jgi:hypothetical protein
MGKTVAKSSGQTFIPREHGATAMLLTPFFAAAILLRRVHWSEFVALVAVACAFAIKDPLVVMGRQRFVWTQDRDETRGARKSALIEFLVLTASGLILVLVRDWRALLPLFFGAATFTALAVTVNVRNRQRSEWFQTASAVVLTATSLIACLAVENAIPNWCWLLWMLSAMQAAAGIFVVHARLDARIAARKGEAPPVSNRRAAFVCQGVLIAAAVYFAWTGRLLITVALIVAATGYLFDLMRQKRPSSLQLPLKSVGRQALGLSIAYTLLIIAGLWGR